MLTEAALGWLQALTGWKWLVAGLVMLGAEIFTGTTYLLWAGLAALLTGVVALGFAPDWRLQIGAFAAFTFILVVAGRRVLRPNWSKPGA